jgi:hypothetical protein
MIAERRPWGAITGWSLALAAAGLAAFFGWSSWIADGENAVLRTDLAAAYAELEALRALPEVVSLGPVAETMVPADAIAPVEPPTPVIEGAAPATAIEAEATVPAGVAPTAANPAASTATQPAVAPAASAANPLPAAVPATLRAQ